MSSERVIIVGAGLRDHGGDYGDSALTLALFA